MIIYLYIKTHRKTGLKYLGKTESTNPDKYRGSGKRWINHIKKHGYDVETEILRKCNSYEEVKEWGLYYSELWNIVESDDWANLTEETGTGFSSNQVKSFWDDPSYRNMMSDNNSKNAKKQWESDEFRDMHRTKMSNISKQLWKDEEFREMQSQKGKEHASRQWKDPAHHDSMSAKSKERWENPEHRIHMSQGVSEWATKLWNDPKHVELMRELNSGANNPSYDHTIYHFIHESGIEEHCTRHTLYKKYNLTPQCILLLIKKTAKSHKGWRLVHSQ